MEVYFVKQQQRQKCIFEDLLKWLFEIMFFFFFFFFFWLIKKNVYTP